MCVCHSRCRVRASAHTGSEFRSVCSLSFTFLERHLNATAGRAEQIQRQNFSQGPVRVTAQSQVCWNKFAHVGLLNLISLSPQADFEGRNKRRKIYKSVRVSLCAIHSLYSSRVG